MPQQSQQNRETSPLSEELFNLIVENVREYAVFTIDLDGLITSWNPGVERLLGYGEAEFVGQSIALIFTPADAAENVHLTEMRDAREMGRAEDKRWHQRKNNSFFWANGMVMPLKSADGELRGFAKVMRDDTAQKLAEDNLEQVLASITDSFYRFDNDLRYTYVNRATVEMFGIAEAGFLGKTLWDLFPDAAGNVFHCEVMRALETRKTIVFENYYQPLDRWFENRIYPSVNGLSIFTAEVTVRKHAETALRKTAEKYQTLFNSIDQGFCVIEVLFERSDQPVDYRFLELNPQFEQLSGLSAEAVLNGKTMREMKPDMEDRWFQIYGRVQKTGEPIRFVESSEALNRWFDVYAFRIGEPGEYLVAVLFDDITERHRHEQEQEALLEREQEARRTAEIANQMKDEFLATLSHELRTPLNAILGWAQMLQKSNFDQATANRALQVIERNARAQNQLIEDLLDMSRIITGKLHVNMQVADLSQIVLAAADTARPAAEVKNIRLQVLLDPSVKTISGDPDRLQQVVWNLLSNAIKFTPVNGFVQVRLETIDSHINITVSDSGQGISPEFLPFVFDRFRQADQTSTRSYGGLGLGLAIVRQLVELHGGTIKADSQGVGHGATLTVALPYQPPHRAAQKILQQPDHKPCEAAAPRIENRSHELDRLRILIVDDEPDARELIESVLTGCGAQVVSAASAREALTLIERHNPFDVLVSDLGMPIEDGFSLITKIRALPAGSGGNLPAVALTAYSRLEDRVRTLRSGFQTHVSKPVDANELIAVVANLGKRTGN